MEPVFENVQANEGSSFRSFRVSCRDFSEDHTWHYHPEYELTWNICGQGTRFVGDSVEQYGPGDIVLVGSNLPHCWYNTPATSNELSEIMVIQFGASCFGEGFMQLPESGPVKRLLNNANLGLSVGGDTARFAARLMQTLDQQQGMERLLSLAKLLHYLAQSQELRALATPDYNLNADVNETNRRRIEQIYRFVRSNLEAEISQPQIADRVGLTSQGFSRFFKKSTGLTFVSFVNMVRVNEACRLLVGGNMDITQIAFTCGYKNISNFNRRFQSLKGMTPSEFRLRHRCDGKRVMEH